MTRRRILATIGIAAFFALLSSCAALARGNDSGYPYLAAQAFWRTSRLHVSAQPRLS